jgi:hypothetical protein
VAQPPATPPDPTLAPPDATVAAPPQPSGVITIDLSRLPEEDRQAWQDAIVKANGDPTKVAALFWGTNNRLARLASGQPPTPVPSEPEPVIDVDRVVAEQTASALRGDPEFQSWRHQVQTNLERIEAVQQELGVPAEARNADPDVRMRSIERAIAKADSDVSYIERRLKDADVQENLGEQDRLRVSLSAAERHLLRLRTLSGENETINARYLSKKAAIEADLRQRIETEQSRIVTQREIAADAQAFQREFIGFWPGYVQAAATAAGIPPELAAGFSKAAQREVMWASGRGELELTRNAVPAQLPGFLKNVAAAYLAEVDTHYRLRSAQAGRLAHQPGAPVVIPTNGQPSIPATQPTTTPAVAGVQRAQDIDAAADAKRAAYFRSLGQTV